MRIAEVIGTVTLSRCHPTLTSSSLRLVVPLDGEALRGGSKAQGEPFVAYDSLGGGLGSQVAIAEGAEAAAPFHPHLKPIDAYVAALLDEIVIDSKS